MRVTATLSGWELLLRRNTHHDRFTIMSNLKFLHFPVAAKAVLLIAALGLLSGDDIRRIFDKLELAHGIAAEIGRSVKSGQTQQAERLVNFKFDPARDDVTGHMDRLINILGAKARATEAEVAAHGAATYRTTVAIVGGGTAAALLGAFLLTQFFITLPMQRMARAMSLMAAGDLAVPVNGARRGDEIGAMARAVSVFRNNAMELRDTERARAADWARAEAEKSAALEAVPMRSSARSWR